MKNYLKKSLFPMITAMLSLTLIVSSCESDPTPGANYDETYKAILQEYVDGVVVPTYRLMAEAALEMRTANNALRSNPTSQNIAAAAAAWRNARIYWEESEAFLFGPVGEDALDIDGHIDSWPLELDAIIATLDEIDNMEDDEELTGKEAWEWDAEVIGFHTTEYLLFREGQPRASLTDAELKYLTAATDALVWDCVLAYVAWAGEENVSTEIKNVFNENTAIKNHLNSNSNYKDFGDKLKNATGKYAGRFTDAISEISDGAADIADEVGATKIAAPYDEQKVLEVESWYSWNSLKDYENNIVSIKNAYYGGRGLSTPKTNSLSAFVASKNAQLDTNVKAKIDDCINKIRAIGTGNKSFYEVVRDQINGTQVAAAVDACAELGELFKQINNNVIE
ncbi:MAG: hypothetical protein LBQ28_06945 [Prevotellaceae bacterium]|jgi:uncharacterized iron-regulated protein|nr:hypothetical protein [Prevotellaceae bacterium]